MSLLHFWAAEAYAGAWYRTYKARSWLTAKRGTQKNTNFFNGIHIHRTPILFTSKFFFRGGQTFPFLLGLHKLDFIREMDVIQSNTLVAGYTGWRLQLP